MRYFIDFEKTINQFVPHYLGGRKLILFLQSTMRPLRTVNDSFRQWAKDTRIEASMTSQIFKLEWFLNKKFREYFLDENSSVSIDNEQRVVDARTPIFFESALINQERHMLLYTQAEEGQEGVVNLALYNSDEGTVENKISFTVMAPQPNTDLITEENYRAMLSYYIDKYRLAGKTYKIEI